MTGKKSKSQCHRIREKFSPYIDGRLTSIEQDAVKYHVEVCAECHCELETMEATVKLLHRMPYVATPRSFTLAKAAKAQTRVPVATGLINRAFGTAAATVFNMNRLRIATAAAVILLAVMLSGDATGLFDTENTSHTSKIALTDNTSSVSDSTQTSADPTVPNPDPTVIAGTALDGPPEAIQQTQPSASPAVTGVATKIEPEATGDASAVSPSLGTPPEAAPNSLLPKDSAYSWLRPLEIAFAAVVAIMVGLNILVWQRKRQGALS
ncbi:MAG: zf-HC2 domain-containing protein [Dehalococcoidia bacterium]|nr:zf-HC2 domain-containing protein [Dehalococcoidia bacterium]